MKDETLGGIALIAGSIGGIVTMAMHPTGHEMLEPGAFDALARRNVIAHALAIASTPVLFLGALALSSRLAAPGRCALAALVTYGFAGAAVLIAATASGLVAPICMRELLDAAAAERATWHVLLEYNGAVNQAFAKVFTVGSSVAIVLWSVAIARTRGLPVVLGVYGLVLGSVTIAALVSGHLRLNLHGMGLVILGQGIWFVTAGVNLCKRRDRRGSVA